MKHPFVFLPLILILLITSCGPSAEEIAIQTVTASTAIAASWTKTPTPTLTHTPTFTPTITPTSTSTPTITPTPLGGGSGQIACLNCINGIFPSISLVKPDGTGATLISDNNGGAFLTWSKDGSTLAHYGEKGMCVTNVNSLDDKCLDIGSGDIAWFAWSPDRAELAVAGDEITIANFESGEKRVLVEGAGYYPYTQSPDWSPDGKKIVYVKKGDIYSINIDSTNETLLVKNAHNPIWSPDGAQIAYISGYGSPQNNIFVMNADGKDKVKLTPNQSLYGNGAMVWSSDGKYIVYLAYVGSFFNGLNDIYAVEVKNHKVTSFTKTHNVLSYTVSPDESAIAFTLGAKGNEKCNKSFVISMDGMILSEWKDIFCFGEVGPWRPTSSLGESDSLTLPTKGQSWEFETDGDAEEWEDGQNLSQLTVSNGNLNIEAVDGISWIHSPLFLLDANAFSKIEIRMKIDANSPIWLGFITSTDPKFDGPKTNGFNAIGDGQFHNYIIDMSKFATWKGMIMQLFITPVEKWKSIEIDYIRITKP